MKNILLYLIIGFPFLVAGQSVFINEIHYDNASGDLNEGIEIAGPAGTDLSSYTLVLYNGNGGTSYNTTSLSGTISDQQNGYGTIFFPISGIQNGSPDGIALIEGVSNVLQFLSYEGAFTAVGGAADGLLSEDIGVTEPSTYPIGLSLQLTGEGTEYIDFVWTTDSTSTYNAVNAGQTFGTSAPTVFINEIHYDNASGDVNEGIEVAGTAGTDLAGWTLHLYNGSNGASYSTTSLSGILPDQDNGFGTLSFLISGIQNGAPDGIVLTDPTDSVIQFLSYEGSFSAVGGVADGLVSEDIGISETGSTPTDFSLQLTGTGSNYTAFTWVAAINTFDQVNTNQSFGGTVEPEPTQTAVFINEIHYDNASTDTGEGIELAGEAGIDLSGWSLVLYNGSNGTVYNTSNLAGTIPNQEADFGTIFFAISGIQNGSPDGIALVSPTDSLIQFLSYEGTLMGVGGPADGVLSEDIGVEETGSTLVGTSLQLEGTGSSYADFSWALSATSTYDAINTNQSFSSPVLTAFINEIHYDNASSDVGEGIEVAGNSGLDLSGWSLVLYNGNGGVIDQTVPLSGLIPDQDNGYGTLDFPIAGIQNGAPDGVALTNPDDSVIQFVSYEGSFTATNGPATGLLSEDIGVSETGSTPAGFSLQLEGTGQQYADFIWAEAQANTFGQVNLNQSFGDSIIVVPPTSDTVTVAQARTLPLNSEVVLQAVLTATSQFGGPAYLQDSTAGIALFDPLVHADGAFNIGDKIWINASIGAFNDQIQLVDVDTVVTIDTGVVIVPAEITLSQLSAFEGQLVTIDSITFDPSEGILFPNTNYEITDASGTQEVRIDGNTDLVGRNRPESSTTITGIVGRFQADVQLLPRFIPDLPESTPFEPGGSDIPFSQTLDIATWNMEFFGTEITGFGPSDITTQASNALTVLSELNADIIALQEVSNDSLLQVIVESLPGYQLVCSDVFSRSFQTPDPNNPFPPQKLCFLFDTTVVDLVSDRAIFDEFYTQARLGLIPDLDAYPTSSGASSFWSSGRLPYQLIADVTIGGVTERVNIVNIHAKSGSGANDLARRVFDNTVLKDTLDAQYPNDQVILLGDYNDDVFTSIGGGASTYEVILSDSSNYRAVTSTLSENDIPTFIGGSGSTIDHITVSDELFADLIEGSESIYFPFNAIENYEFTTSDHLPVVARFEITPPLPPLEVTISDEQTVFIGYGPQESAILEVTPSGGLAPYTFTWSNGANTNSIEVMPTDTTLYTVTITDALGNQLSDSTVVNVVDVSCRRWRSTGVQVCYYGRELCVSEYYAERLIQRGATLGSCNPTCDVAHISNYRVFPNPFIDKVKLSLDCSADVNVKLIVKSFFTGQHVYNETVSFGSGTNETTIDLSHVRRGFYVLIIKNEDSGKVEKAITLFKRS